MEVIIGELLLDWEAKKSIKYAQYLLNFREMLRREFDLEHIRYLRYLANFNTDKKLEKPLIDTPEAAVPEVDLEDVHLRYISDYLRELRTKQDYWKKEFLYWNDIISQKNWKKYDKKVKDHVYSHKHVLKTLDKLLQKLEPSSEDKNYFSQSLDPERVQNLITAIKEKESEDDNPFEDIMMKVVEADKGRVIVQFSYILYTMYAMYPIYRLE